MRSNLPRWEADVQSRRKAGMDTGEEPQCQRFCRAVDCGVVFWICRCCDRGQQYCGDRRRQKARRQQRREANRRHRQSREGRLDHRDRQRAYRQRWRQARVTDTPSGAPLDSGSIRRRGAWICRRHWIRAGLHHLRPYLAVCRPLRRLGMRRDAAGNRRRDPAAVLCRTLEDRHDRSAAGPAS